MGGVQCDWAECRKFIPGDYPPPGWLIITRTESEPTSFAALLSGHAQHKMLGTFCSNECALKWLYAMTMIGETHDHD